MFMDCGLDVDGGNNAELHKTVNGLNLIYSPYCLYTFSAELYIFQTHMNLENTNSQFLYYNN